MKKIAFVLLIAHTQLFAFAEPEFNLLTSVLKILQRAQWPHPSGAEELNLNQVQQYVTSTSIVLEKIRQNSEALAQIMLVRDGLYGNEGSVLREILVSAAKDRGERDALIATLQYEKCTQWFWQCGLPPLRWNTIKFKLFSNLKSDLDVLEETIRRLGELPPEDFANLDPRSLDPYENYFQLYASLEPNIGGLFAVLFEYYTGKSLRNFNEAELLELLERQISFLNDKEDGALGFIRKAQPRS